VPEVSRPNETVVILTALDVETRAVLRQLDRVDKEIVSGTVFFRGKVEGWNVVVAEIGPGNVGAAAIGTRAIDYYKPAVALFVGVAGGVKDVKIGDVVVATKVYGYESGKDQTMGFKPRPDVMNTAHELEQHARALRQSGDWKKRLDPTIKRDDPRVFVDPIAAGEKVVAARGAATAKFIRDHYGDALAVEMEGRGFLEAVHISHPALGGVVRGISDLLSGKRRADKEGSQERAADAACAVAFEILAGLSDISTSADRATRALGFNEKPSTFTRSAYFEKGEILARVGAENVDEVSLAFVRTPEAFLRVIPTRSQDRPIPLAILNESATNAKLLRATPHGVNTYLNKYGVILYAPDATRPGEAPLHWATQLFQNGELWSVTDSIIIRERGSRPDWWGMPLIPAALFEQVFYRALYGNVAFAANYLGLSFPCTIELGLVDLAGAHLGINNDNIRGPIQAGEAIIREELDSAVPAAIGAVLLEFFNEVHDKTGYPRPTGLYGFPPGPPRS
jgi:nucleoside phosphorylase